MNAAALSGMLGAGLLAGGAVWVAVPAPIGRYRLRRTATALRGEGDDAGQRATGVLRSSQLRHGVVAVACGFAAIMIAGGPVGVVLGIAVAIFTARQLGRATPAAERARNRRITADLPTAADLLSACLLAGAAPVEAVPAVAAAVGGPLGDELRSAAAAVRLGGDPARCWGALAVRRELAPLARALSRTGEGGVPLAERIVHIADECRERRRRELTAAARRTAVRATLPLGACFLPAFLLIGVIPVVIGLAAPLLAQA